MRWSRVIGSVWCRRICPGGRGPVPPDGVPVVQRAGGLAPQRRGVVEVLEPWVVGREPEVLAPERAAELAGEEPGRGVVGVSEAVDGGGVEDGAGQLAVGGPGPAVEVVGADGEPDVVDDADLGVDVDRRPLLVLEVEHVDAAGSRPSEPVDRADLTDPARWAREGAVGVRGTAGRRR